VLCYKGASPGFGYFRIVLSFITRIDLHLGHGRPSRTMRSNLWPQLKQMKK
jgi:hypothetical protein